MLATCLGCGCVCDDIQLRVESNVIVEAGNACPLGVRWFGDGRAPSRARVRGKDASVDEALATASDTLRGASRPLIYLAPDISCETQRSAIAIADALHGVVDGVTSATSMSTVLAAQETGRASATLGEIRNRADVVVFWGVDPAHRYPRFWTRYAPEPAGIHVAGRHGRSVIAVDVGRMRGPENADQRFAVMPEHEVATLTEFSNAIATGRDRGGLLDAILRGRYVAIIADAEGDDANPVDRGRAAALLSFTQALNGPTRCALISLRAGGNRSGAESCLTAHTGYPAAVDFSTGYPRYRPHDSALERLSRGAVDVALIVGAVGLVPPGLLDRLAGITTVVIGPRATESALAATAAVDTGVVGIHESGTALRMDDVALPLFAAIAGPPATVDIVTALAGRLTPSRRAASAGKTVARPVANRQ
jgi:formylmethanofuran dehydrogenase subunit B